VSRGSRDAPLTLEGCRPQVRAFALLMERELRANDHKGGWRACAREWLAKRARQETKELKRAVREAVVIEDATRGLSDGPMIAARNRIAEEAADVANFAMMVADKFGCLDPGEEKA
jgi:hypothetical protein